MKKYTFAKSKLDVLIERLAAKNVLSAKDAVDVRKAR
jgi:hypothetical protein